MDYSKLSDYEVSKLVAMAIGGFLEEDFCDTHSVIFRRHGRHQYSFFEPCTNPSDAWPIIVEREISIIKDCGLHMWCATGKAYWADGCEWQITQEVMDANPLRAAMIVFLMMQDLANVQDNPA